ncbi:hypothetical protein ZOSMA_185G00620 [Zostera marina]|uniref:Uncharacterized protein n=1 Tax=Zostera marina TaxID=29655 RepID=A0A0K9PQ97_ZOSMR|nr:hypothetical protein ZOSMA_185G00620 [Zostera marina]
MNESITTTASTAIAAVESRIGQQLVKKISNVCFSFFVVFVLVFTVLAITYQPPDPWMDTSKALTISFTDVLLNSTFNAPDDGSIVLPTGEDTSVLPQNHINYTVLRDKLASSCTNRTMPDSSLNCSDPGVLLAIQMFNAKVFQGIVFLAFETPVAGDKPGECDAAWSFRNRMEKSWRRYRDFRRFNLVASENCTFEVVNAGKFRSGKKASKRARLPGVSDPTGRPVMVIDRDINDAILVVGREDFRKGKYLYYSRGGDHCKGMNHYMWSFLCGLGEAQYLNRTFVMDMNVCLSSTYNPNSNRDEDGKDFRFYYDYEHLKETASVVEEKEFLKDWSQWEVADRSNKMNKKKHVTVRKVPTYKITPKQLKKDHRTIIWRQFDGPEPENYWYRVCEGKAAKYINRPWHSIWKSKRLMNIVSVISGKLNWDYDAVHVVRGTKAENKELWPNLDRDTAPMAIVNKLLELVKEWRNLYIATNEPFYHYFDKLRSHYKVHLLDDYKELWGEESEWRNETTALNSGNPVEFDGFMRMAVDTEVFYRAKTQIQTFNDLTSDCKDGINSCSR